MFSWDDEPVDGSTCAISPRSPSTPRYPCALLYIAESYSYAISQHKPLAIRNITILVTSPAFYVVQMCDSTGCEVLNVRLNALPSTPSAFPPRHPIPPCTSATQRVASEGVTHRLHE